MLQDSAAAANGCFTGTGAWSWAAVSSVGTLAGSSSAAAASYARTGSIETDLRPVCDSAQSAIDRINADVDAILKRPEVIAEFRQEGADPVGGSPERARQSVKEGIAKWSALIREIKLSIE